MDALTQAIPNFCKLNATKHKEYISVIGHSERNPEFSVEFADPLLLVTCADVSISLDLSEWEGGSITAFIDEEVEMFESHQTLTGVVETLVRKYCKGQGEFSIRNSEATGEEILDDEAGFVSSQYASPLTRNDSMYLTDDVAGDFDDQMDLDVEKNRRLMAEIENVKNLYGESAITTMYFYSMKVVEIHLKINPLEMLKKHVAVAWEIDETKDIVIILQVGFDYPNSSLPPSIEVLQFETINGRDSKMKIRLGAQIKNLLEFFVAFHWSQNAQQTVLSANQMANYLDDTFGEPKTVSKKRSIASSNNNNSNRSNSPSKPNAHKPTLSNSGSILIDLCDDDHSVSTKKLKTDGITLNSKSLSSPGAQSKSSMLANSLPLLNVPLASKNSSSLSVINSNSIPSTSGSTLPTPKPSKKGAGSKSANTNSDMKQQLMQMGFDDTGVRRVIDVATSVDEALDMLVSGFGFDGDFAEDFNERDSSLAAAGDAVFKNADLAVKSEKDEDKMRADLSMGLLAAIVTYVRNRLPRLNNYCVICDKPHVFSACGNMLKPAVCTRELCCWAFQQLGVGADAAGGIAVASDVVDLLICFTKAALRNTTRRVVVFDPFPQLVDPDDKNVVILSSKNQDWALFEKLMAQMPSIQQMTQAEDFKSMKGMMDKTCGKYIFPLMEWIIGSNRSHIVRLNENISIEKMSTPFQYLLLSDSPEKEEKFQAYKKQYGTTFAFHGSPIENWHGILRKGLVNASGTKIQMHGAAYGSGIYLSPQMSVSMGYSSRSAIPMMSPHGLPYNLQQSPSKPTSDRFLECGESLGCLAICEVVDKDIRKSGQIWVHPHAEMVCTRFLFVYPNIRQNGMRGNAGSLTTDNIAKELQEALAFYTG